MEEVGVGVRMGGSKGPYPLGNIGVIGDRISCRRPILSLILLPITLWVPMYWTTRQLIAGRLPLPGDGKTAGIF